MDAVAGRGGDSGLGTAGAGGTLVHFGAGSIGRSFIGQLFARSGYEVVFVDVDERIVEALNRRGAYRVVVKRNLRDDETLLVEHVRAVDGRDARRVASEVARASLVSTSVGAAALPSVFPRLAEGLVERRALRGEEPLDIVIAENLRNAAGVFSLGLSRELPSEYPLGRLVGLVETSIGKMVPLMSAAEAARDPLAVFAEEYNTLIVARNGFRSGIPKVAGLQPVDNIAAYVDRKLFVHNLGHAATAYLAFRRDPRTATISEALEALDTLGAVRSAMEQSAEALAREYPGELPAAGLREHIEELLDRFRNRALGDTLFRVGRDLRRKLGRDDRLVGAMLLASKHGVPFDAIAEATRAAFDFRATDELGRMFPGDATFLRTELPKGIPTLLREVCGLSAASPVDRAVIQAVERRIG